MIVNTRGARVASRRVGRRLLVCVSAVALLAACNGNDDDTTATTPEPTSTTHVATTLVATTDVPTTSAATSTPSTTATPTTEAATTSAPAPTTASTPAPTTAETTEEQGALAAVDGAYRVWRECMRSIPTCDTAEFETYLVDPQLRGDRQTIADYQAAFYEAQNVDSLSYDVLEVNLEFTIPYVLVCERDGTVLIERLPDATERVVDDTYAELVREVQLRKVGQEWRVEGFATRERVDNQVGALCA